MNELQTALNAIEGICNEWREVKNAQAGRGTSTNARCGYLFNNKLYELAAACDNDFDFGVAADMIFEDWNESARLAAGYSPERWNYNKYFEHNTHHGSYFNFREDVDGGGTLDFWANPIGLEWDSTEGAAWEFTPFEKALQDAFNWNRFKTDALTPEEYSAEDIAQIVKVLTLDTIPDIRATLDERRAVIDAYNRIKAAQCDYLPEEVCV